MTDEVLLDLVINIYRNRFDLCNSAAEGVLFQLRELLHHQHNRQDYRSVGEFPENSVGNDDYDDYRDDNNDGGDGGE